ncbi:MAG: roadblock/LC7 domain-containing protein, partial [Anaerolineae bacterium]
MPPLKLVKAIREAKADMSVMIIPLIGQDVPDEVKGLGIQGVLPKPFFVGDLPKLVGQAVGLDLESEVPELPPARAKTSVSAARPRSRTNPAPAPPPRRATPARPQRRPDREPAPAAPRSKPAVRTRAATLPTLPSWKLEQLHKHKDDIVQQLQTLNSEIRAEVILLTAGTELIAKAGTMADSRARELAVLVAEGAEAVSQAAAFLGERDARFEQSLHEGSEFRLYSYSLGQGVVLSLALGTNVPLGILRHQTKQTSRRLMKYIQ